MTTSIQRRQLLTADEQQKERSYRWPDPVAMEQHIWQHLQENAKLNFQSIELVKCNENECEIRFSGIPVSDGPVAFQRIVMDFMWKMNAESLTVRRAVCSKTEISPGVNGTLVKFFSSAPTLAQTRQREGVA